MDSVPERCRRVLQLFGLSCSDSGVLIVPDALRVDLLRQLRDRDVPRRDSSDGSSAGDGFADAPGSVVRRTHIVPRPRTDAAPAPTDSTRPRRCRPTAIRAPPRDPRRDRRVGCDPHADTVHRSVCRIRGTPAPTRQTWLPATRCTRYSAREALPGTRWCARQSPIYASVVGADASGARPAVGVHREPRRWDPCRSPSHAAARQRTAPSCSSGAHVRLAPIHRGASVRRGTMFMDISSWKSSLHAYGIFRLATSREERQYWHQSVSHSSPQRLHTDTSN